MSHHFPEHICAAVREDDLVLLDLRNGQYACARGVATTLRIDPARQQAQEVAPDMARAMITAGVLRPGAGQRPCLPFPPEPKFDLGNAHARPRAAPFNLFARALADMIGGYWRADFAQIVARARKRQALIRVCGPADEVSALARGFADWLPWVPFQGDCLFRAVLLQALLARRAWTSTVVVGVQTWPFEAHAWVQDGAVVLDDGLDHVTGFTPILAF